MRHVIFALLFALQLTEIAAAKSDTITLPLQIASAEEVQLKSFAQEGPAPETKIAAAEEDPCDPANVVAGGIVDRILKFSPEGLATMMTALVSLFVAFMTLMRGLAALLLALSAWMPKTRPIYEMIATVLTILGSAAGYVGIGMPKAMVAKAAAKTTTV